MYKNLCYNTPKCMIVVSFVQTLTYQVMHNIYQIFCIIYISDVPSGLERALQEKARGGEIKNLFQQLIKIQRQWCYRAPIKKLSLHWQWHLFQSLLTTPLVPVCESQPTASHSAFLWMKQVQLTSFKPKQENPLTVLA